jgi:hypothetical protein
MCRISDLETNGGAVEIKEDGSRVPISLTKTPFDVNIIGAVNPMKKKPGHRKFTNYKQPVAKIIRK